MLGSVHLEAGTQDLCFLKFFNSSLLSLNTGLTTQKMEGRRGAPELPGACGVCFLTSGSSMELFAGDVDTKL